jgi:hypothetical protein
MHKYALSIFLNHSIILPAILSLIRYKAIKRNFYPFVYLIWIGSVNETVSLVLDYTIRNNALNSNVYVVAEFFIILYQFKKWNEDESGKKYFVLGCIGLMIWIADNFVMNTISQNNSLFRASYSLIIVLLSVGQLSKIIVFGRGILLGNAMFIICLTFLFYFSAKAFVESLNAFHLGLSRTVLMNLWVMLYFVNFISNILYAIAVLCIPMKHKFISLY